MKRLLRRLTECDDGFSLTELLVVTVLMGLVLSLAWNFNQLVSRASAQSERETWLSAEVRTPMMYIDKLLMQNAQIEPVSGDYSISFFTDVNLDDVRERNVIKVENGELTLTRWNVDGTNTNIGAPIQATTLSRNNVNVSEGQPLFTYLDSEGVVITNPDAYAGSARSIRTTIVAEHNGKTLDDSRETFLRNRN